MLSTTSQNTEMTSWNCLEAINYQSNGVTFTLQLSQTIEWEISDITLDVKSAVPTRRLEGGAWKPINILVAISLSEQGFR